jgi:GNAT superfamily N-acetyltransferase
MTGAIIRPAIPADADAVRVVVDAAYGHYVARIGKPPGPMLDDYVRRIADGQVWLLEHGGRIAGILVLEQGPRGLLLDNIAVLPDSQGKGFGRMLIGFAEAEARGRNCNEIHLYTHALMHENIALYRRLGFVDTARRRENGYDRVYMTKHL